MKVSIIVAVYKDVRALELILESLAEQTYENFEVIVAEDGQSLEMQRCVEKARKAFIYIVKHTTQEDQGVRKARSQNNALLASSGEYVIFIDGDCIPYSNFVEGHVSLAEKKTALSGRRVNISIMMVPKVRDGSIKLIEIEKNLFKYPSLWFDKKVRFKQAIYLKPNSLLYKIVSLRDASTSILGSNFSCFKKDMVDLNGFDESYSETAIPDDIDWEWRFIASGVKLKSCKNVANQFHLDHKIHDRGDATPYLKIMNERKKANMFVCEKGLNTHNDK